MGAGHRYPHFQKELLQVPMKNFVVRRVSLHSQMEKFLIGPLKTTQTLTLIIIDALNGCKSEEYVSEILSTLSLCEPDTQCHVLYHWMT